MLFNVVETEVERHPVVQERCRIAERKVVTVVLVVGDDTSCVRRTQGDVGLVLVGTGSQRHVVLYVRTGIEEVFGLVVAVGRRCLGTPRLHLAGTVDVGVLELRHHKRVGKLCTVADRHAHLAFLAFLGGDHDDALCGSRTVEGCSGRTTEDADRLDVLRVDVGNAF